MTFVYYQYDNTLISYQQMSTDPFGLRFIFSFKNFLTTCTCPQSDNIISDLDQKEKQG